MVDFHKRLRELETPVNQDSEPDENSEGSEWESLLASEPYSQNYTPKEKQMINVVRPQKKENNAMRGVQFLSPRHVLEAGGSLILKIQEVTTTEPDNFGNPVVVYFVDSKSVQYSKGFSLTSDNLADLCDLFGKDETKWGGKKVTVTITKTRRGQEQLHFAR